MSTKAETPAAKAAGPRFVDDWTESENDPCVSLPSAWWEVEITPEIQAAADAIAAGGQAVILAVEYTPS